MDSDDKDAYIVQAEDYAANALYGFYEYNDDVYYNCFRNKVNVKFLFPRRYFGK